MADGKSYMKGWWGYRHSKEKVNLRINFLREEIPELLLLTSLTIHQNITRILNEFQVLLATDKNIKSFSWDFDKARKFYYKVDWGTTAKSILLKQGA